MRHAPITPETRAEALARHRETAREMNPTRGMFGPQADRDRCEAMLAGMLVARERSKLPFTRAVPVPGHGFAIVDGEGAL